MRKVPEMDSNVIDLDSRRVRPHPPREDLSVYTVPEVAYLLSLSLSTTYALFRRGEIPGCQLGRRWVIGRDRFHAWVNELGEERSELVAREEPPAPSVVEVFGEIRRRR